MPRKIKKMTEEQTTHATTELNYLITQINTLAGQLTDDAVIKSTTANRLRKVAVKLTEVGNEVLGKVAVETVEETKTDEQAA